MSNAFVTRWIRLIAVLVCLQAGAQQGPPPASVSVRAATEETMAATFLAPGTVVSRNDARVAAELAGRLTWVAEVGTLVNQGDTLARIEDRQWRLQLKDNEAQVARLEANLVFLRAQLARLEKLAEQNNAARTQLDESRSQIAMSEQDLVRAKVAREQTEYQIERAQIRAMFPGRVTERLASAGEFTSIGQPILRLVDTVNVEVRAQAPVNIARFLTDGMPVTVRDDRGFADSVIRSVVGVGDERSRMIEVRIALAGTDWVIGSAVRVALPQSEPSQVVAVPRDALILRENSTYVYRLKDDNTVEQVIVRTGMGSGSKIEVLGGLAQGDRVVVRGGERLRPGQSVVVSQDS